MTREEAKQKLKEAEQLCQAQSYDKALTITDELFQDFPESLSVVRLRVRCLAGVGRESEALACCDKLEGKLDAAQLKALRDSATAASAKAGPAADPLSASGFGTKPVPATAEPETGADSNVFIVEQVFPASSSETTVTGHVAAGTFYAQDSVSLISSMGLPLLAPIKRIGSADAPMKMVRKGQSASLLLEVEPQHIAPGSKLVSSDSADSYAETMVVTDDAAPAASAETKAPPSLDPGLQAIERILNERGIAQAREKLIVYLAQHPTSCHAFRLMARSYLEAEHEDRDIEKALDNIKKAYEHGGADDAKVLETLANTMGSKGEAEHGLRFLERAASLAQSEEDSTLLAKRVTSYRTRYKLGHIWEFSNGFGEVFFESEDVDAIEKALSNQSIPPNSRCRRDKVGEWGGIEEVLLPECPQLQSLYTKPKQSVSVTLLVWIGVGFLAGACVAGLVKDWDPKNLVMGGVVGMLPGAILGILLGRGDKDGKGGKAKKK